MAELKALIRKPVELVLVDDNGEEQTYLLRKLSLRDFGEFEAEFGSLDALQDQTRKIRGITFLLWRAMLTEYPEATLEQVADLLPLEQLDQIQKALNVMVPGDKTPQGVKCPECGHKFPFDPSTSLVDLDPKTAASFEELPTSSTEQAGTSTE